MFNLERLVMTALISTGLLSQAVRCEGSMDRSSKEASWSAVMRIRSMAWSEPPKLMARNTMEIQLYWLNGVRLMLYCFQAVAVSATGMRRTSLKVAPPSAVTNTISMSPELQAALCANQKLSVGFWQFLMLMALKMALALDPGTLVPANSSRPVPKMGASLGLFPLPGVTCHSVFPVMMLLASSAGTVEKSTSKGSSRP